MSKSNYISFPELKQIALQFGLEAIAFTNAASASSQVPKLESWQSKGYAGDLEYMKRSPHLFTSPTAILPETKSIVLFTINYPSKQKPELKYGHARVARYAWGQDYHLVIKKRLNLLIECLNDRFDFTYRAFTDAVPFLERFFAQKSGLGFIGKNTMLIRPKLGSYFFIAEILWSLDILDPPLPILDYSCGNCRNCIQHCPTKAIVDEYTIDAKKCISYLTIEKKTAFSEVESKAIGEWIFGCDVCQEVCPFNHIPQKANTLNCWSELGDTVIKDGQISLEEILTIQDEKSFKARFKDSPILRTKRRGLIRNACAVSVNLGYTEMKPLIERLFLSESDPIIKQQAKFALEHF